MASSSAVAPEENDLSTLASLRMNPHLSPIIDDADRNATLPTMMMSLHLMMEVMSLKVTHIYQSLMTLMMKTLKTTTKLAWKKMEHMMTFCLG